MAYIPRASILVEQKHANSVREIRMNEWNSQQQHILQFSRILEAKKS